MSDGLTSAMFGTCQVYDLLGDETCNAFAVEKREIEGRTYALCRSHGEQVNAIWTAMLDGK